MSDPFQNGSNLPKRKKRLNYFDPASTLDPLAKRILQIEIANGPGLSALQIKKIGNIAVDERTINNRRALGAYQKVLDDYHKDAISLILDTQSRSVRKLRDQIDSNDPRIAQRAALFFAESARDMQLKRAEFDFGREMANFQAATPTKHEVKVIFEGGIGVLGQPLVDIDAQGVPVPEAAPSQEPAALPSPDPTRPAMSQQGSGALTPPEKSRVTAGAVMGESGDGVFTNPFDT